MEGNGVRVDIISMVAQRFSPNRLGASAHCTSNSRRHPATDSGWRSITNAQDVAINAVGGSVVALLGSFAISIFRSPRLLDEDRISQIQQTETAARSSVAQLNSSYEIEIGLWAESNAATGRDLSECREKLARKHPSNEAKERHVRESSGHSTRKRSTP